MRGSGATGMVSDESDSEGDAPAAAPIPIPAKTKTKKDVVDAWFLSSEKEKVQVVDDAAPATKGVEVEKAS